MDDNRARHTDQCRMGVEFIDEQLLALYTHASLLADWVENGGPRQTLPRPDGSSNIGIPVPSRSPTARAARRSSAPRSNRRRPGRPSTMLRAA